MMRYGTKMEEGRRGMRWGGGKVQAALFFVLFSQLGWLRRILP